MSFREHDVYYQPEVFGLTKLIEVEQPPSYDFNIFCVWMHKDGNLYYGHDSGCSCPSPFEDFTNLDSLQRFTTWTEFEAFLNEWAANDEDLKTKAHTVKRVVAEYLVRIFQQLDGRN